MMVVDYLDLCNKTYIATYYYKSSSFIFYRFLNIGVGCDMYGRKVDWLALHLKFGSVYFQQFGGISRPHVDQLQI